MPSAWMLTPSSPFRIQGVGNSVVVREPVDKRTKFYALNDAENAAGTAHSDALVHRKMSYGRAPGSCGLAGENSPATARSCNSQGDAPALRAATIFSGSTCAIIIPRETLRCSVAVQASL